MALELLENGETGYDARQKINAGIEAAAAAAPSNHTHTPGDVGAMPLDTVGTSLDLNTITLEGVYNVNSAAPNWPFGSSGSMIVTCRRSGAEVFVNQLAFEASSGKIATRSYNDTTNAWSKWAVRAVEFLSGEAKFWGDAQWAYVEATEEDMAGVILHVLTPEGARVKVGDAQSSPIYHEGHKPTPTEIGALDKNTGGVVGGAIRVSTGGAAEVVLVAGDVAGVRLDRDGGTKAWEVIFEAADGGFAVVQYDAAGALLGDRITINAAGAVTVSDPHTSTAQGTASGSLTRKDYVDLAALYGLGAMPAHPANLDEEWSVPELLRLAERRARHWEMMDQPAKVAEWKGFYQDLIGLVDGDPLPPHPIE